MTIEPATRLEGEGKISIILNEKGEVDAAFFQVVEFRGFENFCIGRLAEEMPRYTTRICGVCPWAHHLASAKAVDALFGREVPEAAHLIRELGYCAFMIHDHALHFFILAGPDFLLGLGRKAEERNIVNLVAKNPEIGKVAIETIKCAEKIEEIVAGEPIHAVFALPGGVSKNLSREEVSEIEQLSKRLLELTEKALNYFEEDVFEKYKDFFYDEAYVLNTYQVGLVDGRKSLNFYRNNELRVVDLSGSEAALFDKDEYLEYIAEYVESWTYIKMPYLKFVGWKGLEEGEKSGVYVVGPTARLSVVEDVPTEKAGESYERYLKAFGKPAHQMLSSHWARLIENVYSAERILEIISEHENELVSGERLNLDGEYRGVGVGVMEAPRGLLIHHYEADEKGVIRKVNVLSPTTHNNAALSLAVKKAAQKYLKKGLKDEAFMNMIEVAYRAFDPCLACGSHCLPGKLPLQVEFYDHEGKLVKVLRREVD